MNQKKTNLNKFEYNHKAVEEKWQKVWLEKGIYEPSIKEAKNPFYNLMMFPYPSGEGLHTGHAFAFTGADIYGRFKKMHGLDLFEPIGFDSFGIHSENYALKIGQHPKDLIAKTTNRYENQMKSLGIAYSWKQKLATSDISYYKWTQWVFVKLFKAGLAYRAEAVVNWCPYCLTVLADEQVISQQTARGKQQTTKYVCERCGTVVKKKNLTQWFFRITAYAERLLANLDKIDWTEKILTAQRNWIGKSKGTQIMFQCDIEKKYSVTVFTTRPDTIFGVTYLTLAPEHPLVTAILNNAKGPLGQQIRDFIDYSKQNLATVKKTQDQEKEKKGIFTGYYAINPVNNKKIPLYIADYVLMEYGSGAVMGVPAHDQRDWEFAKKHGIEIVQVIKGADEAQSDISQKAFTDYGILVRSGEYDGLTSSEAISKITADLKKRKVAKEDTRYHLRDWIISRQRYWGPPIPMIYCEKCAKEGKSWFNISGPVAKMGPAAHYPRPTSLLHTKLEIKSNLLSAAAGARRGSPMRVTHFDLNWNHAGWYPVPEEDLPVELPFVENFKPTGTGVSPLAQDKNFLKVKCPGCGSEAKRETDVSDTFLDSAWYFLRYPSLNEKDLEQPWDREITKKWLPVDMYIGGAEHAVLHLLYSRFVTMALFDMGFLDFEEPFPKFRAHGLVIKDGAKMSKSRGNVVVPDDYIAKFGADTLRCYLMFCGRYSDGGDFRDSGIEGMQRFLKRVWKLVNQVSGPVSSFLPVSARSGSKSKRNLTESADLRAVGIPSTTATRNCKESVFMMHKTIKKVSEDIESLDYNTAIASLMEWVNFLEEKVSKVSNVSVDEVKTLLLLIASFAPHMTEELWQRLNVSDVSKVSKVEFRSIHTETWPGYDEKLTIWQMATIIVQVNGKLRDKIEVERGVSKEDAIKKARNLENVSKYLAAGKVRAEIFVPDKLINFVVN